MNPDAITIDELMRVQRPADRVPPHFSPDGSRIALSTQDGRVRLPAGEGAFSEDGLPTGQGISQVLVADTSTGEVTEPFAETRDSWGAQFSPDGRKLAAYVKPGGDHPPCLASFDVVTGQVEVLEQAPVVPAFGFEVPRWTPDSQSVVAKLAPSEEAPGSNRGSRDESGSRVRMFSYDPEEERQTPELSGVSEWYRCDLAVVDADSGEVRRLAKNWPLTGWKVSPDGSSVAVMTDRATGDAPNFLDGSSFLLDLVVVPLGSSEPFVAASSISQEYGVCFNFSPAGSRIAYLAEQPGEPPRIFTVPTDRGAGAQAEPRELTPPGGLRAAQEYMSPPPDYLNSDYEAPRFSTDGAYVYCRLDYPGARRWTGSSRPRQDRTLTCGKTTAHRGLRSR